MSTDPEARPFYRSLSSGVVVRCAGVYDDAEECLDPVAEDPEEPVGRVVLELPDYLAESLARMIVGVWEFTDRLHDGPYLAHVLDREVAEALQAAAGNQSESRDDRGVDADPSPATAASAGPPHSSQHGRWNLSSQEG